MASTIAAIAMVAMLGAWHLRIRRHANWRFSSDGRFYITLGYPAVAIAVYWLTPSASGTDSMWILGTLWSFAAMVCFVRGFDALN
jgi:hypothetical protein